MMPIYTTDEAIEVGLVQIALSNAIRKTDSTVPDSLGDQLVRMKLNLSWSFTHGTKEEVFSLIKQAKELLA